MTDAALLATMIRGDVPEAWIRGHVVVLGSGGEVAWAAGDPLHQTSLRSCAKPFQAVPVAIQRAALGLDDADLAVICGSHSGEPSHQARVGSLLARAGVGQDALECGPQWPLDRATAAEALVRGPGATRLANNCSGKHAGMLLACRANEWPTSGYSDRDHPLQRAVRAALSEALQMDMETVPWGIDGCGVPTYGVALEGLARAFLWGTADPTVSACFQAMASQPEMVAGRGRLDTLLMRSLGGALVCKGGAAGLFVAALRDGSMAVAIKLEAGAAEVMPVIVDRVLRGLGIEPDDEEWRELARPVIRNLAGAVVGRIDCAGPPV